jgi:hypothetical protein
MESWLEAEFLFPKVRFMTHEEEKEHCFAMQ